MMSIAKYENVSDTVNSLYSRPCGDLELVSSLAGVRDSDSLFQSNVCNLFLPGILLLSFLSGCPLGESLLDCISFNIKCHFVKTSIAAATSYKDLHVQRRPMHLH